MSDPLEPSPDWQAQLDQLRAIGRDLAARLASMVEELKADGWSDEHARELVVAIMIKGARS